MQDKLIINHIFSGYKREINLEEVKVAETIFAFNEYEPIEITLESNNYEVILECLSYKIGGNYSSCEDNILNLKSGIPYKISGEHEIDLGYIPSKYHITLSKDKKSKECYFEVLYNHEVSEEGMTNIIESLNEFISGLSIDFFRRGPINNISTQEQLADYYVYELLAQNEKKLHYACNQILLNLKMTIKSGYSYNEIEKKQNLKTIKNNAIRRNLDKYSNLIKKVAYDTNENIILKKYLLKINRIIKSCEMDLNEIYSQKQNKIMKINEKIESEKLNLTKTNSFFTRKSISNHIKSLTSQLDDEKKWADKIKIWQTSHESSKKVINKLLYSDEFEQININNQVNYSNSFYNNANYKFFMDLYKILTLNSSNKREFNSSELFTDRKSYNIFEMYGFILIQNILKENGFEFCDGYDKQIFNFGSDACFVFKNKTNTVKVYYDHYCEKYYTANDGEIVSINSRNCKPDYIITVFDSNDIFKCMIMIEMKYRKLRYMIDYGDRTTETDETLSDYMQLKYCLSRKENTYIPPSHVLLIYPSLDEKIFTRYSGEFIGINVLKNFSESEAYLSLKKYIVEALK